MIWLLNCAKYYLGLLLCAFALYSFGQTDVRKNGTHYLSKQLQDLQNDADKNPAQLWILKGQQLWQTNCIHCHSTLSNLKSHIASFPKLDSRQKLVNLEDYLGSHTTIKLETDDLLALSAALHDAATGEQINTRPIEPYYSRGQVLWKLRMGRINLACVHCHEERVGANMKAEVISQAQPTGFPIYRLSWQTLGSLERRLRACYSGVQAPVPPNGAPELRDLELFLKVRANGMTIDGPSIRR